MSWLLIAIGSDDFLLERLVLKGGTCLRKVYFPEWRYSDDLDFTAFRSVEPARLVQGLARACSTLRDEAGIYARVEMVPPDPGQTVSCEVAYVGPLQRTGQPGRIKIDMPYGGGEEERILIDNPPRAPDYRFPEYHPEYKIEYQWAHFLEEHESRMKQYVPEIVNPRTLYVAVFGATELSHRLQRHAVPQYYRGRYQWLLPLYITRSDLSRPDLVAALEEDSDRGVYVARTLLPPEAA
ncbi:MAG: nucleotidyl transferase AbiEii/AbiGii toxin family protein, partial [Bacillota bacterium]